MRFNHGTCNTVLNLLEAIYLRLRKVVVERVTVVKFGVDNRDSDGTGCFRGDVKRDATVSTSWTLNNNRHLSRDVTGKR